MLAKLRHHEKKTGVVQKSEYIGAENYLFKQAQQSSFPEEYELLASDVEALLRSTHHILTPTE